MVSQAPVVDRGGVFGFRVMSNVDLRYLRSGGTDELEVVTAADGLPASAGALLREWLPRPGRPAHVRLHEDGSGRGYALWIDDGGWYHVEPDRRRITIPPSGPVARREERLWGIPALLTFLARGETPLHAGVVDVGGVAVGFGAPSRHGKTTLAAAFWRRGHRLLSEDLACLRWEANPIVIPGPAMLRPRVDIADRLELTDVIEVDRDDDRVHFALTGQRAMDPTPVPLGGFMFLREATHRLLMSPVDPAEAMRDLWILTFHLGGDSHERDAFGRIADLAATVPMFDLHRPMELGALDDTVDRIAREVLGA